MIYIKTVESKSDLKRFTQFPNKLFKKEKAFVPALSIDEMHVFDQTKNPAHAYCSSKCFLAYKDGKLVGRIAGIINHKINENQEKKVGRFSRLDMIDDINVTKALLDAVSNWLKSQGIVKIIGPMGFTDLDRMGMLIEGFDYLNLFITIWNPPYYKIHLETLGFEKDVDWVEKRIQLTHIPEKIERVASITKSRYGYQLIKLKRKKDVYKYIYDAFFMYNIAFNKLYGFYPITKEVMDYYIKQMIQIVKLDYLWFVLDKTDKVVGFGLMMPSLSKATKKSNGRLFPFGLFRILWSLKWHKVIDLYFIAIDPDHQGKGLPALMLEDGIKQALRHKVLYAETGPELELNTAILSQWKDFDHITHRKRRAYKKQL